MRESGFHDEYNKAENEKEFNPEPIIQNAVRRFGEFHQIDRALEEMGELIVALQKFRRAMDDGRSFNRGTNDPIVQNVVEEIADVKVVMKSLNIIFGGTDKIEMYKIKRLDERMKSPPIFNELE